MFFSLAIWAITGAALCTEVTLSAHTVDARSTLRTELIVCAGFTFLSALLADHRTVGAASSTVADILYAIFTFTAFGAIAALASHTFKAHTAAAAKLIVGAVRTFFIALGTELGTFRTSLPADTDIVHTIYTFITGVAVITVATRTVETDTAIAADTTVGALLAFFSAILADENTF